MKRIKELQVNRFKMLTSWLTFTAFVAASVNPAAAAALTFAPSRLVTSPPEAELTLKCGDDKDEGTVQFWHTPFGDLQTPGPGIHGDLNPAFVHHDGSLVITNASVHHSGLYYCVLQHTVGAAVWQYELHIGPGAGVRLRRDVGPLQEDGARLVSDGTFAGAVAASVLLTFVCGFSAGALARTHVLRCLEAVTRRVRSPRKRRSDVPDHQSATMTTLPPMYDNESYETEQETRDESTMTPSPPAKPRRSFKINREEVQEVEEEEEERTAYLEGCDYRKEEEEEEEEEAARGVEEEKESSGEEEEEEEVRESSGFYLLEDEGSQTETDEEKGGRESREEEEEEERERREETVEEEEEEERERREETVEEEERERREETVEEEEEEERESREEMVEEEEEEGERREETVEEEEEEEGESSDDGGETSEENVEKVGEPELSRDSEQSSSDSEEEEDEPPSSSSSSRRPGRRVIRLYQYDEDGQRYSHLPDPVPADPGPTPPLKHRSLSLTRLSTIMAVASASPLDGGETGTETETEESTERPHFHMEI